ncbi:cyclic dehypoxanthinyl futalosine synthase [Limnoglobus roseus]|uniref:Cyclic dehypoxanthine futalosine synthase n=1 Tax=Limnoglobus roseus TaxID=2598579 RepID=A0A5C1AHP5_9BACT|nr:cyclic dehypoxanthinyl futalosine synthase [Limnoglobus roseus]QEL18959.1 dehypoxanthine futalosine cyclase [Limnoglobus roseus]
MSTTTDRILSKAANAERLTYDEGVELMRNCRDLNKLGRAAHAVTMRLHPEPYRTFNIDRNINYTNVCAAVCDFCAFYRKSHDADAYVMPREELHAKVRETVALGGDQILLQGGMHPSLKLEWYEEMLADLRANFPTVNLHAFSPPELWHFHKINKIPLRTVLERLKAAGLGSIPGGGGEILVDRVRRQLTKGKALTDEWLAVMREWQLLGGKSTCTMMFGHIETLDERVEHLDRLRQLQDETGGFTAFICWTMQPGHKMADAPALGSFEYLRVQAISRLYLDNIPNIQSSWVTQGGKIGQAALFYGANDMGSLMIEENVVASAGTVHCLTLDEIKSSIRDAGWEPRQRNVFYQLIDTEPAARPKADRGRSLPILT